MVRDGHLYCPALTRPLKGRDCGGPPFNQRAFGEVKKEEVIQVEENGPAGADLTGTSEGRLTAKRRGKSRPSNADSA